MFDAFEEKGKIYTQVISKNPVKVIIQTETNRIFGVIHVRPDERLKDTLDASEDFIAVTTATVFDIDGKELMFKANFLALNRNHILWATPEEEVVVGG